MSFRTASGARVAPGSGSLSPKAAKVAAAAAKRGKKSAAAIKQKRAS